jgi:hypothetical protein
MLKRFFHAACDANDRRRARNTLQEFCEDRVKALRALDQANRYADRAMREAAELECEQFPRAFFGHRDLVRTGFSEGSAAIFNISDPTQYAVTVRPLAVVSRIRQVEAA